MDGLHRRGPIWYFSYRGVDGKRHDKSTRTRNFQEARRIRAVELEHIRAGRFHPQAGKAKLRDAAERWLEFVAKGLRGKSLRNYKCFLKPILEKMGGLMLEQITPELIQAYQVERSAQVLPRTVNLETHCLRRVMRMGRTWSRVADDFHNLRVVKQTPGRALNEDEFQRLTETARKWQGTRSIGDIVILALNTGMRLKEIRYLRRQYADAHSMTVKIRREGTKTEAGERIIPLNAAALGATKNLLARAWAIGARDPDHFILPTRKKGGGWDPTTPVSNIRKPWLALLAEAGIKHFRFHDLRHHFVTMLAEKGVPVQVAMDLVGHMDATMTRLYTHVRNKAMRDAVELLADSGTQEPK